MIKNILLVGLGGGVGSIARYLCQKWIYYIHPHPFPWGTFLVNLSGCFLIGLFWGITTRSVSFSENWGLFLMTGLCGGFTTFSALSLESMGLIKEQRFGFFIFYAAGSIIFGLLATYLGIRITK